MRIFLLETLCIFANAYYICNVFKKEHRDKYTKRRVISEF